MTSLPENRLRYQVTESLPPWLALGLGAQLVMLTINPYVILAIVIFRGGGSDDFLSWGIFATVLCCGMASLLQAMRIGRIGGGYLVPVGTSAILVPVSVTAMANGGPALLATLIVACSLVQMALSIKLSTLRRVLTPTVTGTIIMLLPVAMMPIVFDLLQGPVPEEPLAAKAVSALVTVAIVVGIGMRGSGTLRVWALALGLVGGGLVSALFGIYDFEHVLSAPWVGLPHGQWPGFHLDFELEFWSLLPAFLLITLVAMPKSIGIAIATQRVSWRRPRAVDFRAVQGAAAAESASNLFAGLSGAASVMPFPVGPSAIQLSKVASRNVGIYAGLILIILAFVPKTLALIIGLPSSVVAGGLFVMLSTVFMTGMQEVLQDGASQRKTLIVGFSFWAGAGFEAELIFPEFFAEVAGGLFQHGMVAGGLIAILLTLADALSQRSSRFSGRVDAAELPKLNEFLGAFASRCGWNGDKAQRLQAVAEEVLALLQPQARQSGDEPSRLLLTVRKDGEGAVLEFMAGSGDEDLNLEDRIALLSEQPPEGQEDAEVSIRLLRHLASSVRHQQFHNAEVVIVHVDA